MDFIQLIEVLARPAAYPFAVAAVEVIHTHISVVFLAGDFVYKIKKAVDLGFLDFSTLEKRRHFCAEEVRLNRRLAPSVYLGVVPVTQDGDTPRFEGSGPVVDWAVKMQRLRPQATLYERIDAGTVSTDMLTSLARRLADFHTHADSGGDVATFGRFEVVRRNVRENFEQAQPQVGITVSQAIFDRLRQLTEQRLEQLAPLIDARAERGVTRDTHGDLHLDHVYVFPERSPPDDLVIVDCIEFNERFRYADPVADMAFLVMDLKFHGRRDLARVFADVYVDATGDTEGRRLLPFYTAYRAAVRGKVEGFELTQPEIPEEERRCALARARAHWLLALGELEERGRRPCLLLIGGLQGSGKSTLSRALADAAGVTVVRSDIVRKELAAVAAADRLGASFYTQEWNDRTYAECLRRAEELLLEGGRVIVDASFLEDQRRQTFLASARRCGVPGLFLHCKVDAAVVEDRLRQRRDDASDADWHVYQQAAKLWQETSAAVQPFAQTIGTGVSREAMLEQALAVLRQFELA